MTLAETYTSLSAWANRLTCSVKVCTSAAICQRIMICIGYAVVLHDFANTLADSLKALPESTRKHIACN